jgi:PTH1 family peptidyl-tRNA hydrolase
MKSSSLIVGLGNPGEKYKLTRHNIGFMVVDQIAKKFNCSFKRRFKYSITTFGSFQKKIILIKPTTYMNLSGKAVNKAIRKYNIALSNLLIVSDDLNLPLGKIRLSSSGSAGGQKGLKSVIECLNTEKFPRLRVGIAGENKISDIVEYVLSPFSKNELTRVKQVKNDGSLCVMHLIEFGINSAMNEFNR